MSRLTPASAVLKAALQGKFQRDVLWNVGSLVVLAVSGIGLQVLIGLYYDEAVLGVFNQVWAPYVFFSQAAVGGVNLSALRAIAEHNEDRQKVSSIILGALWPTLVLATASSLLFWSLRHPLAAMLDSPGVALGMEAATPGLFFFALNKVLLSVVNGLQRMRAFAVLQAARYLLILGGLFVAIALDLPGERLAFVFSFAEVLLFLALAVEVLRQMSWPIPREWIAWSFSHLRFGLKSTVSGMLLELNSRVDVLMLGYFLSDTLVGVYSMAAMLAEGVFQLLVVLQNNYNPILAQQLARKRIAELEAMVRKGKRLTYLGMTAVGAAAVAAYPLFLALLTNKPGFQDSWLPFGVLILGIVLASGYYPFSNTLLMGNQPGWHTLLMCGVVGANAVFNALLIPRYGIAGAAAGTALSFVVSVLMLRALVRVRTGVRL